MYGVDGWCRSCGTPLRDQCGPLIVQGSKFPTAAVWMPNWHFDTICLSAKVAAEVAQAFRVELGEVHKPRQGDTGVRQLLIRSTDNPWYARRHLTRVVRKRHREHDGRRTGSHCRACGRWKWLPALEGDIPVNPGALPSDSDVAASPETFGDGLMSFRHFLVSRPLAEHLVSRAPRNWDVVGLDPA